MGGYEEQRAKKVFSMVTEKSSEGTHCEAEPFINTSFGITNDVATAPGCALALAGDPARDILR
jgi:hypothetical protein